MTNIIVELPPDIEPQLKERAIREGTTPEKVVQDIVSREFSESGKKNEAALKVMRSFLEEDEEDQRDTLKYLRRVLNEDRPSQRKIFR